MAWKSLPPPPDDSAARRAPAPSALLPASVSPARRAAGALPPPPTLPAAPGRAPIKLPTLRRWHLYVAGGVVTALAAWLWLPGRWTEKAHGRPPAGSARSFGQELSPAGVPAPVDGGESEKTAEPPRAVPTPTPGRAPALAAVSAEPPRTAARYVVPAGFAITPSTVSPDGLFGVLGPDFDHDSDAARNQLIELATGRVLATFGGGVWAEDVAPGHHRVSMHRRLSAAWSTDGSSFLWDLGGKWTPWAFVLVRVKEAEVEWQADVYKAVVAEILQRTRAAAPRRYAAARAYLGGSNDPSEGFVIDVNSLPTSRFSFPVRFEVTLTSNPKAMPDRPPGSNIDATMQAILAADGTVTSANFAVADDPAPPVNSNPVPPPPSTTNTAQRLEAADRKLNVVYGQLRGRLDERGKAALKADEMQFLRRLDPVPKTDPRRAEMLERRTEELLRWR